MACTNGKCVLAGNVRRLREAGMEALRAGDAGEAEALLRRSVEASEHGGCLDVSTAHSTYRLALALNQTGRYDEAAEQFEKALTLARGRAGSGSKLYKTILGHFAQTLPARAKAVGE
jgi:tetratricopeptide (TPR) repeat protein